MMMFSEQFMEQDSDIIDYNGKKIHKYFRFDKKGTHILKFSFVSVNSKHSQAIHFHLSTFKGDISINGEKVKIKKSAFPQLVLEEKYSPQKINMLVILEEGFLTICNSSDLLDDGTIWRSLYGGCAMIIEEIEKDHYKFYCNDHENDDDFDDLIFELKIENLDENQQKTGFGSVS